MIVELVEFTTVAGLADDDFRRAAAAVDDFLADQPGFLARRLLAGGADRDWVDLVWWTDLDSARAAARAIAADERCAPFLACLEPGSVTLRHLRVAADVGRGGVPPVPGGRTAGR